MALAAGVPPPGQANRRKRVRRGRDVSVLPAGDGGQPSAPVGVRKSLDIIHMRTAANKISLIQRRAVNVLLSIAQRIDRTEPTNDGVYTVDLAVLERLLGFQDDGNRKYMIALIRQIVGLQFEFLDGHSIHAGSVIAEIEVCFKTRTMKFSLPAGLKQKLLHPERFTHLKLVLLNRFTSHAALCLYELASSCFTHPARRTQSYHWEQLSTWLTGSNTPHGTYREFSKLLQRAIEQVNDVCPTHTISLNYTRDGRSTRDLFFSIHEREQSALPLDYQPCIVSQRLVLSVATLSLKASDLEELLLTNDEDYLIAQAELVVRRITTSPAGSVAFPRAYFLKAVAENWADVPRESAPALPASDASGPQAQPVRRAMNLSEARQRWWEEKNVLCRQRIAEASEDERSALCASIDDSMRALSPAIYESFKAHGLARPIALAAAVNALAKRQWTEPSEEELSEYARSLSVE
ncbi:replication initiation protein [Ottowia sp.]|uniref:replication initiation protein n=1 Tax=Ottowia sp. TaxID=1898956 RepID=UPI0025D8372D|nr:replication initiation protein [Ottowia sp.]MBK6616211.1 replication initiation protein [Ottowia sp.]